MKNRLSKFTSLILLILPILIIGFYLIFRTNISHAIDNNAIQKTPDASQLQITASDLQNAGFTGVKQESPQAGGRFRGPADYFEVSDRVNDPQSEAPNIVMVDSAYHNNFSLANGDLYVYGTSSHPFDIVGGRGQEGTMFDGRIAINFIKGNNYTVIMGPNRQKIEALAQLVVQKVK